MGGYCDLCQLQECFVMLKTVKMQCGLLGTSKQRAPADSHSRQGGLVGISTQGGDGCAHPAIVPHLSLTPPNLIEALSILEPLSYYTRYLLESTNTIIPTLQVSFISAQKALECLALSSQARNERHTLASMFSQTPFFPIQALSSNPGHFHWNLSNLTVSDKNEVDLDASGEGLKLSCLL